MRGYIPRRDTALLAFARTFAEGVANRPGAFGLMASDAAALEAAVGAYAAALARCQDVSTRTKVALAAKDAARSALLPVIRFYAQQIKANGGVSDAAKVAIGVPVKDAVRTRVSAPATQPRLTVQGAAPLRHVIRFHDAAAPLARAKPPAAMALLLFQHVGSSPPAAPEQARFVGFVTRQPFAVALAAADVGKTAYYYGKWVTSTGLEGPWSAPVSSTVAA
jgi:hypothetical protein